jgi:hypothetical protein
MICLPALIYLVLALISLLSSLLIHNIKFYTVLVASIFIFLWTWLLNYVCSIGYEDITWIILFLPFIFALLSIAISHEMHLYKNGGSSSGGSTNYTANRVVSVKRYPTRQNTSTSGYIIPPKH